MAQDKAADRSAEAFEAAKADLAEQIDALRGEIAGISDTLGTLGSTGADRMSERVRAEGQDIRKTAEAHAARLGGEADSLAQATGEYVGRHPMQALGGAAVAGFLFGFLQGRK